MTYYEIQAKFDELVREQLGLVVQVPLVGTATFAQLGIMSLNMVSLQMRVEEVFGLKFAQGPVDFTDLDRAWEQVKTINEAVAFIEKFLPER